MSKKFIVRVLSTHDDTVMLNAAYVKRQKIADKVTFRFGSFKQLVRVIPVTRLDSVRISNPLAKQTGLWDGAALRVQYRPQSNTLHFGPLVCVLLRHASATSMFGKTTAFCKELADAALLYGGSVIFSTPNDVASSSSTIQGWYYHQGWRKASFPFPDIVYNRLTSRKIENKSSVQQFLRDVKARGGKVFNERYLDKNEVFQLLKRNQAIHSMLPESHTLQNAATLMKMCRKHRIVFLKPVRGSLGKGIIRIVRQSGGNYSCQYATMSGTKTQTYTSLPTLYRSLASKLKSTRFQVQQGIPLLTIHSRPVDFRALVQKNETGQWAVTSLVARIAGNQHFVSNLARGGSLSPAKEALLKSNLLKGKANLTYERLRKAALAVASELDQQLPGQFAEFGVDLAASSNAKVWLIEVNSKPSKNDDPPPSTQKIRPSIKHFIKYCHFLAKF